MHRVVYYSAEDHYNITVLFVYCNISFEMLYFFVSSQKIIFGANKKPWQAAANTL